MNRNVKHIYIGRHVFSVLSVFIFFFFIYRVLMYTLVLLLCIVVVVFLQRCAQRFGGRLWRR